MASIKDIVLEAYAENPGLSNDALAELVRQRVPGASTTAASVSSIKSNARRSGELENVELAAVDAAFDLEDEGLEEEDDTPVEVIAERIKKRFKALDRMADGVMKSVVPALIISGPAGLGKSFGVKRAIELRKKEYEEEWLARPKSLAEVELGSEFKYDYISGSVSAVGLYIALWNLRDGGLIVLDDCDNIFADEVTLNILKTVLDSGAKRVVSWRKKSSWLKEMDIDPQFEFKGSVIFLTNIDFERKVDSGKSWAAHFKALMDRSLYLHLTIRTIKDSMVRIRQVVMEENMLAPYGLSREQVEEIMDYVDRNKRRFYHLSLRLIHQIALCQKADPENWKDDVEMTKMRAFTEDMEEKPEQLALLEPAKPTEEEEAAEAVAAAGGRKRGR